MAKGTQSGTTTLLVLGDLGSDVIDPRHGWSVNVVFVAEQRQASHHICLVDA